MTTYFIGFPEEAFFRCCLGSSFIEVDSKGKSYIELDIRDVEEMGHTPDQPWGCTACSEDSIEALAVHIRMIYTANNIYKRQLLPANGVWFKRGTTLRYFNARDKQFYLGKDLDNLVFDHEWNSFNP